MMIFSRHSPEQINIYYLRAFLFSSFPPQISGVTSKRVLHGAFIFLLITAFIETIEDEKKNVGMKMNGT